MDDMLKIDHITKIYPVYERNSLRLKEAFSLRHRCFHEDFYALKDVSFTVKKGEMVGIVGRNGAGKSTLLKIITGIIKPSEGKIVTEGKIAALLELGTGFNMEYTGVENIVTVGMLSGCSKEEIKKKMNRIIEFSELGDFIYQPVKNYSSGMFARLAFALSIHVDPDILIVDEALAVGDMHFQLKCMDKFNEFREQGKTILFVTHDVHSVKRFCSRALWIDRGEIRSDGDSGNVTDAYLDFLKMESGAEIKTHEKTVIASHDSVEIKMEKTAERASDLAVITGFTVMNESGVQTDVVQYGEKIKIIVEYQVSEAYTEELVVGVAILRVDNLYICGLNTLLDHITVGERKKGRIQLEYESCDLMPGSYYFDCGLMEKNAYVNLDYKTKIYEFKVVSEYIGEGIIILKHKWNVLD